MHQAKPSSFGCICSLSFTLMMLLPQDSSKHTVRTTHSVPLVPGRDLGAPGQFAVGWCTASPSAHCPQTMQSTASSPCSMEPIQKNPVLSWESEPHTQCLIMQGLRKNVYKYLRLLLLGQWENQPLCSAIASFLFAPRQVLNKGRASCTWKTPLSCIEKLNHT